MNSITQSIMNKGSIEFYAHQGKAIAFIDGIQTTLEEWPIQVVSMIRKDMDRHPGAENALERMGIIDPVKQINQYVLCMYGELNNQPDFVNYKPSASDDEFTQLFCGTCNCQYRGILCKIIHASYGDLTVREIEICRLLADENNARDIAIQLGISVNTVNTHITNILPKIGVKNARAAAVWASRHLFKQQ